MHGMGGLGFGLQDPCLLFWGDIRKWTKSEQTGEAQRRETEEEKQKLRREAMWQARRDTENHESGDGGGGVCGRRK